MKRVGLCSGILLAILTCGIILLMILNSYNSQLNNKLDEALALWQDKKTDQATVKVEEIETFWNKYYTNISFMVQTDKMEHISASVAKLKPLLKSGSDEFYSECESIRFAVSLIYDSQMPRLHSIF